MSSNSRLLMPDVIWHIIPINCPKRERDDCARNQPKDKKASTMNAEQVHIGTICRKLIRKTSTRRTCLLFLAESIKYADTLDPNRWGLTLSESFLRLNVGMIEVIALFPGLVHLLVDCETMSPDLRADQRVALHQNIDDCRLGIYKSVPGSVIANLAPAELEDLVPVIQRSHRVLIAHASETRRNPATKTGHSRALIEYLASYLKEDIPQPSYAR